jgi:PAS domain S-box-containing protein
MKKSRIMIVEDEGLVALAIEKSLKTFGYEVPITVSTGEDAVRKVVEVEPDLVLMDIKLKGEIDGVEAADRIRNSFHVPIVYLTAYSEDKTLERARLTEPFGYITKPFEERTLQATVEMALYKSTAEGKLWRTKEKLQTILRCIGEGILVVDTKGIVEYVNPTAQRILLSSDELPPHTAVSALFPILNAETLEKTVLPVDRVIMAGHTAELRNLILAPRNSGRINVECTLAPYRDENGNTRGLVLAFRDVTERMRLREITARELDKAREIQRSLLPREEIALPGMKVEWFYHPSRVTAGDLFNIFRIDESHAGLYFIDVAGHGLEAGMHSLMMHKLLTPDPKRGDLPLLDADPLSPEDVVEKLNSKLLRGTDMPLCFILYGVIDTSAGEITMVRAGQPYPILSKGDGSLQVLRLAGRILGVVSHYPAGAHELRLEAGDRLFLCSDGVIECGNPDGISFSEDRLSAAIRKTRTMSLKDAVGAIDAQVMQWRGTDDYQDDACLLAIERE